MRKYGIREFAKTDEEFGKDRKKGVDEKVWRDLGREIALVEYVRLKGLGKP